MMRFAPVAACLMLTAGSASAQLVLNEVFPNPNGSSNTFDERAEFIEIYGPANYDLTGYAIALVKGGSDLENGNRVPDIDEAYSLDGFSTSSEGLFTVFSGGSAFFLTGNFEPNPNYNINEPISGTNKRFLDAATFAVVHIISTDTSGKLENDDSSTFMLVRQRPLHSIDENGASVYEQGYSWRKDGNHDVNQDSRLDFGNETPVNGNPAASMLEPVQVVDEIAWSHNGGLEYNTPGRGVNENEINDTPGFNPDAASRLFYFATNPLIGSRLNNEGDVRSTSLADESWIYGESLREPTGFRYFYSNALIDGTERSFKSPTDPNGPLYSCIDGNCIQDVNGTLLFDDYDATDFPISPGQFNDAPAGQALFSTPAGMQFRFVRGDFNFDYVVDCADRALLEAASQAGLNLDDQETFISNNNTPDESDDFSYTGWSHQLEGFNAVLAMMRMDLNDGSRGEWNDTVASVTANDLAAFDAEFSGLQCGVQPCNEIDVALPFGEINDQDITDFLALIANNDLTSDLDEDGVSTIFDVLVGQNLAEDGCGE
ncbi:MAG: hypothetical protein AAGB34_05160 [Planctomycetota bacterium]